jgi:hypothetical protein
VWNKSAESLFNIYISYSTTKSFQISSPPPVYSRRRVAPSRGGHWFAPGRVLESLYSISAPFARYHLKRLPCPRSTAVVEPPQPMGSVGLPLVERRRKRKLQDGQRNEGERCEHDDHSLLATISHEEEPWEGLRRLGRGQERESIFGRILYLGPGRNIEWTHSIFWKPKYRSKYRIFSIFRR